MSVCGHWTTPGTFQGVESVTDSPLLFLPKQCQDYGIHCDRITVEKTVNLGQRLEFRQKIWRWDARTTLSIPREYRV